MLSIEQACVCTLGGLANDRESAQLKRAAPGELRPIVTSDGAVGFPIGALILQARRPG